MGNKYFNSARVCCNTAEVRTSKTVNGNVVIKCVSCGAVGIGLDTPMAVGDFNSFVKERDNV